MSDPFAFTAGPYEQQYQFTHSSDIGSSHGATYTTTSVEPIPRRRPKYTRSKTGCMTCRAKKIKCDETKPSCVRCLHGQRQCTWPECVPQRKRPTSRRQERLEYLDGRPSTASSSGLSDSSTPPSRTLTPPEVKREPQDVSLSLMIPPRRHSAPNVTTHPHLATVSPDLGSSFVSSAPSHQNAYYHAHHASHTHPYMSAPPISSGLTAIPEMPSTYGHSLASLDDRFATSPASSYLPPMDPHPPYTRSISSVHYRSYECGGMLGQWPQSFSTSYLDDVHSYSYVPRSAPAPALSDGHRYP